MERMEHVLRDWEGRGVFVRFDSETGAFMFVALHDDACGTPTGGTRLRTYARPEDGVRDAMRLAEGMTHKWAALGLPFGGGKAVLAVPGPIEGSARVGLFERYGALLNTLCGAFETGEDLGTTPDDMLAIGRVSRHVHGVDAAAGTADDPGPYTARGVLAATHAAASAAFGDRGLEGKTVLVQGVGDVGEPLVALLREAGATVAVCDPDVERVRRVAERHDARVVEPDAAYGTPCDVFAPCAIGGVLNAHTIPELRCAAVVGSANNQLAESDDAVRLHERGILYAPDYVANGAGALAFGSIAMGRDDPEEIERGIRGVEGTLDAIFAEAREHDESPAVASRRRVERTLADARAKRREARS